MNRTGATTSISVFWYGRAGDMPPVIPKAFACLAGELGADIETDYHTEAAITAA